MHGTAKELPHPRPIGDKLREARDTLGVAYLLRQVATQLVKAGKFKLLAEWLEEFKRQVQDAIASVKRTEYSRVRGFNLDNPPENLEGYLQRYQELSNSLFSFFKRSSRDEALSNATSELESWYRGGIVHMEVMGVLKFYEELMGIVDMYVSTIHSVCQSLEGRLYSQHTDEERNKALRFFDDHLSKGTGRVSNTLEVIVGSRQDIDSILTQLRRDLRHDGQGLFAALHQLQDQHLSIFQQAADRLEISYALLAGPKAAKPEGGLHWASLYGEQLKAQIRHITQGTIASAMGLEALLQRQAESAIERFLNNAVKAIQQGTLQVTPSAMAADDELRRVMSKRYSAARDFLMQPTPDVRGAVKLAIRNYIDLVMNLANANWYPQTRDGIEQRQMLLLRSPRDGSPFADVMDELKGSKISVTHSPYFDLNRIDCVTCEVGARIEDIHDQLVKPHLDNYRRTLFPAAYDEMASDYTPHSERHYIDAGHNYLRWLDRRATAHQNGALLIALGLFQHADLPHLFGFFERTTEGYRWKRELRSTDGNRILATTGTAIAAHTPRELINWLNGVGPNSENGRITSDALRQALNADLQHLVYGDPKASIRTGLGLEQAKECFMRHKAQLRDLANSDTVAPHKREALLEQVQFLTGFVAVFDGATPTTLQHLLS